MEWKITVRADAPWAAVGDAVERGSALLSLVMSTDLKVSAPVLMMDRRGASFMFSVQASDPFGAADMAWTVLADILKAANMEPTTVNVEKGESE